MRNKRRHLGSKIFGTTQIRTDEYVLLAQSVVDNGSSIQEADLDIVAIDDMLSMQRIHSIVTSRRYTPSGGIRKNASLSDMISKRLDLLLDEHKQLKSK